MAIWRDMKGLMRMIADEMRDRLDEKMNEFKNNRRGIIENS